MSSPEAVPKEGESEDWYTTVTKPSTGPQMRGKKHFGQNAAKPNIWVLSRLQIVTFNFEITSLQKKRGCQLGKSKLPQFHI